MPLIGQRQRPKERQTCPNHREGRLPGTVLPMRIGREPRFAGVPMPVRRHGTGSAKADDRAAGRKNRLTASCGLRRLELLLDSLARVGLAPIQCHSSGAGTVSYAVPSITTTIRSPRRSSSSTLSPLSLRRRVDRPLCQPEDVCQSSLLPPGATTEGLRGGPAQTDLPRVPQTALILPRRSWLRARQLSARKQS